MAEQPKQRRHQASETSQMVSSGGRGPAKQSAIRFPVHVVVVVIYLLVTIVLFREFIFSDTMLFGSDTIPDGIYTRQYYKNYHQQWGGIPRWNPYILGGLPFIDAMHGDTFYPGAWLSFIMPLTRALGMKLVLHVFLAGLTMFFWLRTIGIGRAAAFLGGLMYQLAPSFVSWLYGGHDAKMYVIALLPLGFGLLERGMVRPRPATFALLGGLMGLLILTSHVQMAYYAYWALGLYFVYRLIWPRLPLHGMLVRTGLFVGAVVLAVMIGAVQLLPAYKFTTSLSVRGGEERTGYEYATSWSMHPEEVAGMVVPLFPGLSIQTAPNTYWGRNPFKLNTEYHGIVMLLMALAAFVAVRDRSRWFFGGLAILSLVYSLGANTPIYRLFYALVPGIKNFRAPSMMIYLFSFAATTLAARTLADIFDGKARVRHGGRLLIIGTVSLVAGAVIITMLGAGFFDLWTNIVYIDFPPAKKALLDAALIPFQRDLWRVALMGSAALMGLWFFLRGRVGKIAVIAFIALIVILDEGSVDGRFITVIDPATVLTPDPSIREVQRLFNASQQPFRFIGGDASNASAMFGLESVYGMHNNELQTYDLFKGGRSFANFRITDPVMGEDGTVTDINNNYLTVAGVRYIIAQNGAIVGNRDALDRAFIVNDAVTVANDAAAVAMLADASFDPARQVILTGSTEAPYHGAPDSTALVGRFVVTRDGYAFQARLGTAGYVVLTENWVPYWSVLVDGVEVKPQRAYGTFMAVPCEAGVHEVTFQLRSAPYETGKTTTLAGLGIMLAVLAASGGATVMRRRKSVA